MTSDKCPTLADANVAQVLSRSLRNRQWPVEFAGIHVLFDDAKTGEELWAEFADDGFYASPILAEGRIHLMDRSGTMYILKPGRELKILGKSGLGEEASSTPAVVGDSFYIRGLKHLFRIGP